VRPVIGSDVRIPAGEIPTGCIIS